MLYFIAAILQRSIWGPGIFCTEAHFPYLEINHFARHHPRSIMQPSGNNTSMTVLSILEHSENSLYEIHCLWHKCKAVLNSWKALDEVSGNYVRFF